MLLGAKLGDMLYMTSICKRYKSDNIYIRKNCKYKYPYCNDNFTFKMWHFLKPLVKDYNIKWWQQEHIDCDLNLFRNDPKLYEQHLLQSMQNVVERIEPDYSPWLTVEPLKRFPIIITHSIARSTTTRYDLNDAVFLGTEDEYETFNKRCPCKFYEVEDALEMARLMLGAEFCYCNESLPVAIGQAIGANLIIDNQTVLTDQNCP